MGKKKKMWLSRERTGLYMFSYLRPTKHKILGTTESEFYLQPSEPIGLRYFCAPGVKSVFGVDIPIGEQVQVWVEAGIVSEKYEGE